MARAKTSTPKVKPGAKTKPKAGRPRKQTKTVAIMLRLDPSSVRRLDAVTKKIGETHGIHMSRSNAVREAIHRSAVALLDSKELAALEAGE